MHAGHLKVKFVRALQSYFSHSVPSFKVTNTTEHIAWFQNNTAEALFTSHHFHQIFFFSPIDREYLIILHCYFPLQTQNRHSLLPVDGCVRCWWTSNLTWSPPWRHVHPGLGLVFLSVIRCLVMFAQTVLHFCQQWSKATPQLSTTCQLFFLLIIKWNKKQIQKPVIIHASLLLWHTTSLRSLCRRPSDCGVGCWGGCGGTKTMTIAGRTTGTCGRWAWRYDAADGWKEKQWPCIRCVATSHHL